MSRPGYVDRRGSARARHARRRWLLTEFGDGERVACHHCGGELTYETLEVDRHPVCGHDGGTYRRGNIVPSCRTCNLGKPCCREMAS